jgi:hypothetical protein
MKKSSLLISLLLLNSGLLFSQVTINTDSIVPNPTDLAQRLVVLDGIQIDSNHFIQWKTPDTFKFSKDKDNWSEKSNIESEGQVGIGTTTPDASAIVDITSSEKGFLLPRMTEAELNAIPAPAEGLLVYCTNCGSNGIGSLSIFIDGSWFTFSIISMDP